MNKPFYHRNLFKFTLLIIIAATFAGCQTLQNMADAKKPNLSVKDVHVTDFAFNEIELTFDVSVENPNPFALHLLSYDYGFDINGNNFVQGAADKGLDIEASKSNIIQVPVRLNFTELYQLFTGLKGEDNADYELSTDFTFNLPVLGKTTVPLKKSGSLPLIHLPQISVAGLKVNDIGFSEADMELVIRMKNPNGFGLLLRGLDYTFKVNDKEWLNTSLSENISISKKGKDYIHIPISLNTLNIGTSVLKILNNAGSLNYSLKGALDIDAKHPLLGETKFPFSKNGKLPVMME